VGQGQLEREKIMDDRGDYMTYVCPKGHVSIDADYCSECGALIGQSVIKAVMEDSNLNIRNVSKIASTNENQLCPDCGTPRTQGSRFCEACRHDFYEDKKVNEEKSSEAVSDSQNLSKKQGNSIKAETPVVEKEELKSSVQLNKSTSDESLNQSVNIANKVDKLSVIISVDNSRVKDDPEMSSVCPANSSDRIFHLDLDENLLGRRSIAKGISPEIDVNDPGASHRHLKFIKNINGTFDVLDLGSANGTTLNGKELEAGVQTEIKIGDELFVGLWTKIRVARR
jgi:uncharacterized Zn finger protein (UPF0148 family)